MSEPNESQIEDLAVLMRDDLFFRYVASWHRVAGDGDVHARAALLLGIGSAGARALHERATILGLIRADGSLSEHAASYVRARIASDIEAMKRGKR